MDLGLRQMIFNRTNSQHTLEQKACSEKTYKVGGKNGI